MLIIFYIFVLGILLLLLYFFHRLIIKYFSLASFLAFGTSKIGVYLYFLFFFGRAMGLVGILTAVENLFYQITSPLILSFSLTLVVDFLFLLPLVLMTEVLIKLRG